MVNSIIDTCVQIQVYKKHRNDIFQSNGKAKSWSDKIYNTLVSELKGMNAKAIQTSINRNVNEIWADDHLPENIEDNAEAEETTSIENRSANFFPAEFVDVRLLYNENAEADDTLGLEEEAIEYSVEVNRKNESLRALYHKETDQEETDEISQIHESIDKIVKIYRNKISKINESHQDICRSFQDNLKSAEEEVSRLNQKDVKSAQLIEDANKKISDLEIKFSHDRKAFDEEVSRLNQKDVKSAQLIEDANKKISDLEIKFSHDRKAFDEEVSRLNQKDVKSAQLIEDANKKITDLEIKLNADSNSTELNTRSRKRLRDIDIVPREKRIRKCNLHK